MFAFFKQHYKLTHLFLSETETAQMEETELCTLMIAKAVRPEPPSFCLGSGSQLTLRFNSLELWFGKLEVLAWTGEPKLDRFWKIAKQARSGVWDQLSFLARMPSVIFSTFHTRLISAGQLQCQWKYIRSLCLQHWECSRPPSQFMEKCTGREGEKDLIAKWAIHLKTVERHHLTFRCYKSQDWWGEWLELNTRSAESIVHISWLQEYGVLLYRRLLFDDSMEPRNIFCFERKNYDGGKQPHTQIKRSARDFYEYH